MGDLSDLDITSIIVNEAIITHFQPLVSVRKNEIIGYEALSRGIIPATGKLINPQLMFNAARENSSVLELDRLCRKKALETFSGLTRSDSMLISLNIDVSTINSSTAGSNHLLTITESLGLSPSNIVIEILENEIEDVEQILRFTDIYRSRGFLIALDDIGTGHSNLDRISLIKPDIIKLDRSLVYESEHDFYRQEVIQSIVSLSHRTGSLVIAEGIESLAAAITVMKTGVDILQGYYFSMPGEFLSLEQNTIQKNLDTAAVAFREKMISELRDVKNKRIRYEAIINSILHSLKNEEEITFDAIISRTIQDTREVECVYILDSDGSQVSATVFTDHCTVRTRNPVFRAADRGCDHSFKNYCYFILAGLSTYTTLPYISFATGNLCITISNSFATRDGSSYILCCDIDYTV